ncbi:hypothetical protein [Crocosphaera sp.]|uniref:hypothetical protein n=1 Tax=Crocosphaera sp. TaxID=2729996 RepID=UPI00261B0F75|nr:hypothetical protein [Crocosphaera sp.]MDJ0582818.1 hypothetical protein [Crocosphaera sp.]
MFLLIGLIYLPLVLSISWIQYYVTNQLLEQLQINFSSSTLILYFSFVLMFVLIVFTINTFYYKTIVLVTYNYIHQRPLINGSLLREVFDNFFSLWLLMLRIAINYFLRSLLLIVPGIIYLINNFSVPFAFIFRQEKIEHAFTYNSIIMKGNTGRVFSLFLYPFIIYMVFALFINVFFSSVMDGSSTINNSSSYPFGLSLFSQIIFIVLYPILINAYLCLFLNAEAQKRLT